MDDEFNTKHDEIIDINGNLVGYSFKMDTWEYELEFPSGLLKSSKERKRKERKEKLNRIFNKK